MIERIFSEDIHPVFARLSGDYNPAFTDPVSARRLYYGRQLTHGIHVLLWALGQWCRTVNKQVQLTTLAVNFKEPVISGDDVVISRMSDIDGKVTLHLQSGGKKVITAKWTYRDDGTGVESNVPSIVVPESLPDILTLAQVATVSGKIPLIMDQDTSQELFPDTVNCLPADQIATLLAISRLTGMKCPGLYSILSEIKLEWDEFGRDTAELSYQCSHCDDRFSLAFIDLESPGLSGTIRTVVSPPPCNQLTIKELDGISPAEFADQKALIIGGSRGLGELCAKILAAGGAEIWLTYHRGEIDARRVVDDIRTAGNSAHSFSMDVQDQTLDLDEWIESQKKPTHLYYFATPHIFSAVSGIFNPELFSDFCRYDVTGFLNTFQAAVRFNPEIKCIYYPSSVGIDELPLNMGEYASAKIAGETLCSFLKKTHRNVNFIVSRLPRVATDQTRSLLPSDNLDPFPVMLTEMRSCAVGEE